jgi:hypothetical protein
VRNVSSISANFPAQREKILLFSEKFPLERQTVPSPGARSSLFFGEFSHLKVDFSMFHQEFSCFKVRYLTSELEFSTPRDPTSYLWGRHFLG